MRADLCHFRCSQALVGWVAASTGMAALTAAEAPPGLPTGSAAAGAGTSAPAAAAVSATPAEVAKPAPGTLDSFFNGKLPEAIGKAKISFDVRLRWEHADQEGLDESDAFTVRTRFGLTTAPLYGFQGMIEGENVSALGPESNYNAAGSNPEAAHKTIVADPPTTEINQAWVGYSNQDWETSVKGGRQRFFLDNHRWIGDVNWRQNQQTYDAVTLENKSVENLGLLYAWLGRANRVYGNVDGLSAARKDYQSNSHVAHAAFTKWKEAQITGYTYLLDLENGAGANDSCASYGASVTGKVPVHDKVTVDYRGEFAWQTDYADSRLGYGAPYYLAEAGATYAPVTAGVGYEVLASDNGVAVRMPLATLHAFNGWADVYLNTPGDGLRDLYAFAQVKLPGDVPLRFVYHDFYSDRGSAHFGYELDAIASHKFGKYWSALLKYAYHDGKDPLAPGGNPVDLQRFWAEIDFVF